MLEDRDESETICHHILCNIFMEKVCDIRLATQQTPTLELREGI